MRPPITLLDRFQQAGFLLLLAGLILSVGLGMLRTVGKASAARRRHGKFVLSWMLAGWLIGGAIGVCIIDNDLHYPNEADTGMAGFGLLIGWLVGMIHGGIVLALWPKKQAEPSAAPTGDKQA